MSQVFLIFKNDFPTDFDGELRYVSLDSLMAEKEMEKLISENKDSKFYIRVVSLDEILPD